MQPPHSVSIRSEISMSVASNVNNTNRNSNELINRLKFWQRSSQSDNGEKKSYFINSEPAILLFSISFGVLFSVSPLFIFWARCVEIFSADYEPSNSLKSATQFCSNITILNDTRSLNIVEKDIAEMSIYIQICSTVATLISAPIFGAWSDLHGRRKPFVVCSVGLTVYCLLQTIAVMFYDRVNVYYFLFLSEFVGGMLGGLSMLFTMASTVVADDSREQLNKQFSGVPLRIVAVCAIQSIGNIIGTLAFSVFSIKIALTSEEHVRGYFQAYVIASACALLTFLYLLFFLKETHNLRESEQVRLTEHPDQLVYRSSIKHAHLYMLESVKVVLIPRPKWTRLCLILLVTFMFIEFMSFDSQLTLLIFKRFPFNWDDQVFEKYLTLKSIASSIGTMLVPLLFTLLHWVAKESWMLMLAVFANGLSALCLSLVNSTQQIFWTIVLTLLSGGLSPGLRTLLAKMVTKEQTARLFSLVSLVIVFTPVVSKTLLYKVYELTWNSWPGFVFCVVAILHTVVFFGQSLIHILMYPIWAASEIEPDVPTQASTSARLSTDTQDSVTVVNTSDSI